MQKSVLITGGGSGIGQALAWQFAKAGFQVFIVGRRLEKLKETAAKFSNLIHPICADVSTPEGRIEVVNSLPKDQTLKYVVHNAATADPMCTFENLKLEAWHKAFATNVEAPLFLTQALLPYLQKGSRILNISSGLAHRPLLGTMAYCTNKAALYMISQGLNQELQPKGILVGSAMPGIVDTDMQMHVRSQDEKDLPVVDMFKSFPEQGMLRPASQVAEAFFRFLEITPDDEFIKKDWSIEELVS